MSGVRESEGLTGPREASPASAFWSVDLDALWQGVGSESSGLSTDEAARRLAAEGPNALAPPRHHQGLRLLVAQFENPIILLLLVATAISLGLRDVVDGSIILAIVLASGALGFWQERGAGRAVDALLAHVRVEAEVRRGGDVVAVPIEQVVPGDVVELRAGDVVPGDGRVIESRSLLVDEAELTGESYPVEKSPGVVIAESPLAARNNAVFMGTHVVSGSGVMLVIHTARSSEIGRVSSRLAGPKITTGFERGISQFGLLLVRAMVVLVTAIFVVNLVLHRPVVESLLFSLALAVGLTPQLLPAIVAVSLSRGAVRLAAEQVIVKRLDAIEDFGAMTVLCTDKTGTITAGVAALDGALNIAGRPSPEVLRLVRLNAAFQHGFPNPLDDAILRQGAADPAARCLDEIPYDFQRKRVSVLVADDDTALLITKGAVDTVLAVCSHARHEGNTVPLEAARDRIREQFEASSADGYRVLALATRALPTRTHATVGDETDMELRGLLTFHDPPKPGAAAAIRELENEGVSVRLVTGDNRLAARKIATDVGLPPTNPLTGDDIDRLSDTQLADAASTTMVFAEVEPLHKERIVRALRAHSHVVGFLGDGINDAPALHAADVGISVDTAVDVAKQAAPIVLLDKSLDVVADGILLGRKTFANTLKYIRVTTSANFGNMLSMAAAAAFLPFLPLLPRQILLLNFLSDIPGTTISADNVDPEQLERPRAWDIRSIRDFMIVFGLLSSLFDILTFVILRTGFDAGSQLFRSAWFVESTATELAVMLVLRTNRPFIHSRPGRALLISTAIVAIVTIALPYSALADPLGFVGLPSRVVLTLIAITALYVAANELAKWRFLRPPPIRTPNPQHHAAG